MHVIFYGSPRKQSGLKIASDQLFVDSAYGAPLAASHRQRRAQKHEGYKNRLDQGWIL